MKILVVEDDAKLMRLLSRVLSEEGFDVCTTSRGGEVLPLLDREKPDLLLLDWMLPDVDGLAVCRAVRSRSASLPVLMLTARGEVEDRVTGLDGGADDYMVKPFEVDELLARLRALLRRTNAAVTSVGPLQVAWRHHKVYLAGRVLDLTAREYDLLTTLVQRSGAAASRSELLREVWGLTFDPGTNLVEVHISRLRTKLREHGPLIETVRGAGYRLRGDVVSS